MVMKYRLADVVHVDATCWYHISGEWSRELEYMEYKILLLMNYFTIK